MLGFLDNLTSSGGSGWNYLQGDNGVVDVYINDEFFTSVKCFVHREDLKKANISNSGLGGFEFKAKLTYLDKVAVFCNASKVELNHSPQFFMADQFVSIEQFEQARNGKTFLNPLQKISIFEKLQSHKSNFLCKPLFNSYKKMVGLCFKDSVNDDKWVELFKNDLIARKVLASQGFLTQLAISSPKILANKKYRQDYIIAFEYFEGKPSTHFNAQETLLNKDFRDNLNKSIVSINKSTLRDSKGTLKFVEDKYIFFKKHITKMMDKTFKLIKKGEILDAWFLMRLFLNISNSKKCFSHGDLHPDNVLIDDIERLSIVDWDEYGYYPLAYDLATFYRSNLIIEKQDLFYEIINDYCQAMGIMSDKMKRQVAYNFFGICYLRFVLNNTLTIKNSELLDLKSLLTNL